MPYDTMALMDAVELIAAGSWGVEAASRALDDRDYEGARGLLEDMRGPLAEGLQRLSAILAQMVADPLTRPEHLAREVMASIAELRGRMEAYPDDAEPVVGESHNSVAG